MKRFRSRFERIQHVRQQQERLARIEASEKSAELTRAEEQRAAADQRLQETLLKLAAIGRKPAAAAVLRGLQSGTERCEALVGIAEQQRHGAEQNHEQALAEFEVARANVRIVEKLVAGERQRHLQETRRHEEADAQERAAQKHARRTISRDGQES